MKKTLKFLVVALLALLLGSCASEISGDEDATCNQLAFKANTETDSEIYLACQDGSRLTNLTRDPANDFDPTWSPDGRQIAFASDRSGSAQLYLMNADGSDPVALTDDLQNDDPVWLPDGKSIAFRTTDGKGLWWWRILDLQTGQLSQYSEPSYDFFYPKPAWSPDGQWVALMSLAEQVQRNDGSSQIHVAKVDGSDEVALTSDVWANISPVWSPDGKWIAFLSERDGTYNSFALYVMTRAGKRARRLTDAVYSESATLSWSADGRQIAVSESFRPRGIDLVEVRTGKTESFPNSGDFPSIDSAVWQP